VCVPTEHRRCANSTHRWCHPRQRGVVLHRHRPRRYGAVRCRAQVHTRLVHRHSCVTHQHPDFAAAHRHSCAPRGDSAERHGTSVNTSVGAPSVEARQGADTPVSPGTVTTNVLPATAGSGTSVTDDGVMGPEPMYVWACVCLCASQDVRQRCKVEEVRAQNVPHVFQESACVVAAQHSASNVAIRS
jgi:hypothetical protein